MSEAGGASGRLAGTFVFVLLCGMASGEAGEGALVRSRTDLKSWQTVMERAQSVRWAWADGADSARVTASNRVSHAVLSVDVRREEDVRDGFCGISVAPATDRANGGGTVVDVGLAQLSAGRTIAESSATLAFVGGVNGEAIVVRSSASRNWRRHAEARVGLADAEGNGYAVYDGTIRGFSLVLK